MTDYIYCQDCKVDISYIKDKNRYVTCPYCKQDIYVGTEKLYKKGKFKHTKSTKNYFIRYSMYYQLSKVKFIANEMKQFSDGFIENCLNSSKCHHYKTEIKKHMDEEIKDRMSDFKYRQISKFIKVGTEFFEQKTDENIIKFIEDELKQNVVKFIEGDIMKEMKSSLQYDVRDFVKKQMTRIQKNPLLEDIEDKVKQYGDKLIEDKIKQSVTEFIVILKIILKNS